MNTKIIRRLIVTMMVLQFLWFNISPPGNRLAPRSPEMVQALWAYETNRSPVTEAAMWEQVHRVDLRDSRRNELLLGLMVLIDATVVYLFWNYGVKRAKPDKEPKLS